VEEQQERLETVEQLADRWQVKRSWVYTKTASGQIPSVKIGKYRRIRPTAADAWLDAQREGA
jgi:excisionase family DNA binding protein